MTAARLFLDTVFVQALLNSRDQHHRAALAFSPRLRTAAEVWLTGAILIEIGNALSRLNRAGASNFIRRCYQTPNMHIVAVDAALLDRSLQLYAARADKEWGLTNCISFVVMQDQGLTDAATADAHFRQAGFRALLLDRSSVVERGGP
jgi:predicted nucleic acid-binding protein